MPHPVSLLDCNVRAPADLDTDTLLAFVLASIDALDHWYGYKPRTIAPGYFNSVQQCCMQQWVLKAGSLLVALGQMMPEDFIARPPCLTTLDASKVDLLDRCGDTYTVDVLPTAIANLVTDGPTLFSSPYTCACQAATIQGRHSRIHIARHSSASRSTPSVIMDYFGWRSLFLYL